MILFHAVYILKFFSHNNTILPAYEYVTFPTTQINFLLHRFNNNLDTLNAETS